jgi:two-component system, LytTR family, sensor kinase
MSPLPGRPASPEASLVDRPWLPWAATALAWASLTALNVGTGLLRSPGLEPALRFRLLVFPHLVLGAAWILLAPLVIAAVRRFPLRGRDWPRSAAVHLLLAALLGASTVVLFQLGAELLRPSLRPPGELAAALLRGLRFNIHEGLLSYAIAAAATVAADAARARRERDRAASRMKEALAEARLDALRFRLQPEFILSTLRMLPGLVERDGASAAGTIVRLGEVLHRTLRSDRRGVSTLRDEVDLLEAYLDIERTRWGGRLHVSVERAPDALEEARLPALLLLPLVQHAVAIGAGSRPGSRRISFRSSRDGADLVLTVAEEGAEPYADPVSVLTPEDPDPVARRLRALGPSAALRRRLLSPSSLAVEVRIPFRTGPPESERSRPPRPGEPGPVRERLLRGAGLPPTGEAEASTPFAPLLAHPALALALIWGFSALYYGTEYHLQISGYDSASALPAWRVYGPSVVRAAAWALLTPAFLAAARRLSPSGSRGARWLASTAVVAAAFGAFVPALLALVSPWFPPAFYDPSGRCDALVGLAAAADLLPAAVRLGFPAEFLTGLILAGLVRAHDAWRLSREDDLRASRLGAALASARIGALESQLRPHFLFNTLNAVLSLIESDPALAIATLVRLGGILRVALDANAPPLVSLSEEIDFCRRYLEIERTRFQDRLTVTFDVDGSIGEALVPTLLLQPVVENAVKHGISRRPGRGEIRVEAGRRAGGLEIRVHNSEAPGEDGRPPSGTGFGLENVRQRLVHLFGERHTFSCGPASAGGYDVLIRLPIEIPAAVPATAG